MRYVIPASDVDGVAEQLNRAVQAVFERRESSYWGNYCLFRESPGGEVRVFCNADPMYRPHLDPLEDKVFQRGFPPDRVLVDVTADAELLVEWDRTIRQVYPDAVVIRDAAAE